MEHDPQNPRIRGEAGELYPQTRYCEMDEGAHLRNREAAIRRDDIDQEGACSSDLSTISSRGLRATIEIPGL